MCVRFWGAPDWAIPGRSRPHGLQAPSAGRCERRPACHHAHRRQPERHHPADPAAGRPTCPARQGQARPTPSTARPAPCRPRLRPRQIPPPAAVPRHQAGHWAPRGRARLRLGPPALGRRARLCAPTQLPAPSDSLRTRPRHPHRVPDARLRDPVLATPEVIMKGLLRRQPRFRRVPTRRARASRFPEVPTKGLPVSASASLIASIARRRAAGVPRGQR